MAGSSLPLQYRTDLLHTLLLVLHGKQPLNKKHLHHLGHPFAAGQAVCSLSATRHPQEWWFSLNKMTVKAFCHPFG